MKCGSFGVGILCFLSLSSPTLAEVVAETTNTYTFELSDDAFTLSETLIKIEGLWTSYELPQNAFVDQVRANPFEPIKYNVASSLDKLFYEKDANLYSLLQKQEEVYDDSLLSKDFQLLDIDEPKFNSDSFELFFSDGYFDEQRDSLPAFKQTNYGLKAGTIIKEESKFLVQLEQDVPGSIKLPNKEPLAPDLPDVEDVDDSANESESKSSDLESSENNRKDRLYKLPPQIAQPERVAPLMTLFPLNDVPISHLSQWEVGLGTEFGNQTDTNILGDGFYTLKSQVKQSLSLDNLFVSKQTGFYLQAKTIKANRVVITESAEPVTLNGLQIQQTFTGSCGLVGTIVPTDEQCTFTPALVTDRNSIDPELFVPTRIETLGKVGAVVSQESLALLAQPGFQNIGANGEVFGLDLFFPNTGSLPGNSLSTETLIDRDVDIDYRPAFSFNRVYQIYKANNQQAKLGRTIYGLNGIFVSRNQEINWPVQAAAQALPKINPVLRGNPEKDAVFTINKNLILAANNVRTPANSFVFYHGGISSAKHRLEKDKKLPKGVFNSLWFGLSPVSERTLVTDARFDQTAATEILAEGGGEGGANTDISFSSILNQGGLITNLDTANLTDFYTQIYLAFLQTPANLVTTNTVSEEVTYYPHFSATGDITDERQVFRYYTGVIAKSDPIAYFGSDYTRELLKDLRLNLGLISYINSNRDYYSRANARLAKTFRFSKDKSLTLASSFLYVFDRPQDGLDVTLNDPIDNYVTLSLKSRLGPLTAGVTQFFDLLPESTPTSTGADISLLLGKTGSSISGYILPQNNIMNYGIQAQLKFRRKPKAPTLSFVWNRARFDFGNDNGGNPLNTTEDKFVIFLRFGSPTDPFSPRRIVSKSTSS